MPKGRYSRPSKGIKKHPINKSKNSSNYGKRKISSLMTTGDREKSRKEGRNNADRFTFTAKEQAPRKEGGRTVSMGYSVLYSAPGGRKRNHPKFQPKASGMGGRSRVLGARPWSDRGKVK